MTSRTQDARFRSGTTRSHHAHREPRRVERKQSREDENWRRILQLQEGSGRGDGDDEQFYQDVSLKQQAFLRDSRSRRRSVVGEDEEPVPAPLSQLRWDESKTSVSTLSTAMNSSSHHNSNNMNSSSSHWGSSQNSLRVREMDGSFLPRHEEEEEGCDEYPDRYHQEDNQSLQTRRAGWHRRGATRRYHHQGRVDREDLDGSDMSLSHQSHRSYHTTRTGRGDRRSRSRFQDDCDRSCYTTRTGNDVGRRRHYDNRYRQPRHEEEQPRYRDDCYDDVPRRLDLERRYEDASRYYSRPRYYYDDRQRSEWQEDGRYHDRDQYEARRYGDQERYYEEHRRYDVRYEHYAEDVYDSYPSSRRHSGDPRWYGRRDDRYHEEEDNYERPMVRRSAPSVHYHHHQDQLRASSHHSSKQPLDASSHHSNTRDSVGDSKRRAYPTRIGRPGAYAMPPIRDNDDGDDGDDDEKKQSRRRSSCGSPPLAPVRSQSSSTKKKTKTHTSKCPVRPEDDVFIEIGAGVQARLRRTKETMEAIANDFIVPATCMGCSSDLFCIADCQYIFCPNCQSISPLKECETNTSMEDKVFERTGLGMGFGYDTLFQMQTEVVAAKAKGRK